MRTIAAAHAAPNGDLISRAPTSGDVVWTILQQMGITNELKQQQLAVQVVQILIAILRNVLFSGSRLKVVTFLGI